MRRFLRLAALATIAALPLLLSACTGVTIVAESPQQTQVIGPVQVSTTFCISSNTPGCPNGNSGNSGPLVGYGILLGYRIPAESVAPASIQATGLSLLFEPNDSYTSELQRLAPAPAGEKWVGYRATGGLDATPGARFTAAPLFTLAPGIDGNPFQGPFPYRTVIGYTEAPSTQPVDCGASLTTRQNPGGVETACVDYPSASDLPTNDSTPTRDLGILSGTSAGAPVGGEGLVGFSAKFAGSADSAATFALTATTNVPGGSATPDQPTLAPASNSTTPVAVRVAVPLDTGPGTYQVTLTAALPNGQARRRTMSFPVRLGAPVNRTPPTITGIPGVGKDLRCELGVWSNSTPRFAIEWRLDGRPMLRGQFPQHTIWGTEAGHQLTCAVTAINDAGSSQDVTAPVVVPVGARPIVSLAGLPVGCGPRSIVVHALARSATPVDRLTVSLDGRRLTPSRREPATLRSLATAAEDVPAVRALVAVPIYIRALRPGIHRVRATAHNVAGTTTVTAPLWRCARR